MTKFKGYKDKSYVLSSSGLCAFYFLIVFCLIFIAAGGAIIGVVIWMFVEGMFMAVIATSQVLTAAIIIWIITGIILVIIAILGLVALFMKSKTILQLYLVILSILCASLIIVGILALIFRSKMNERVRGEMENMVRNKYGIRSDRSQGDYDASYATITKAWDRIQDFLDCCGVFRSGYDIYRESKWFAAQPGVIEANKPFVPVSCCTRDQYQQYIDIQKCQLFKEGPPFSQGGIANEALNTRGCYEAGRQFAEERTAVVAGFGFAMAVVLALGIICGIILYIGLKSENKPAPKSNVYALS